MLLLTSLEDSILIKEFNEKVKEIDTYFLFLETISKDEKGIYISNVEYSKNDLNLNHDVVRILKANIFLMLYNLIESSFTLAIENIFENVNNSNSQYLNIIDELKKLWIEKKYNNFDNIPKIKGKTTKKSDFIIEKINNIANDIIHFEYKLKENQKEEKNVRHYLGISGNINTKKIVEVSNKLGIKIDQKENVSIKIIKDNRNDLAHGLKSFIDCGKDYTIQEIENTKNEAIKYMKFILKELENYIINKKYIKNQN